MPSRSTRKILLETAAQLFQEHGYSATGLNLILSESGTPKGSLYFHFPGGKEQLAAESVGLVADRMCEALRALLDAAPDPATGVNGLVSVLAQQLVDSDYRYGCPVSAFVVGSERGGLAETVSGALQSWETLIAERLVRHGFPRKRAAELATFALSAVEGAVMLSKAHRDVTPLKRVARELAPLLSRKP
jgi:TetR/AcrR family transcriptional repressor of lmrAB and yxaGH operons